MRNLRLTPVVPVAMLLALRLFLPAESFAQSPAPPSAEVQMLLQKGMDAEAEKKPGDAETSYQQALKAAREQADQSSEAKALINLGRLARLAKKLPEAQNYLDVALPLCRKINDPASEARCLYALGNVAADSQKSPQAIAYFKDAAALFLSVGRKKDAANSLLQAGSLTRRSGQAKAALPFDNQALPLFQGENDDDGVLRTEIEIGNCYGDLQDAAQALQHFEPALELAKKLNDSRHSLMIMNNIAVMRTYRGELRQAIDILAGSAKIKEEQRDFTGAAVTLNNLSVLSFRVGDILKALETAHHALDIARANDDGVGIATALEGIGGFYYGLSRFDDALTYCRDAVTASRKTEDGRVQARNLTSFANVCEMLKRYKEERDALANALKIYRRNGDADGEASALYSLSTCLYGSGNAAQAKIYAEQARVLYHKVGDAEGEGMVLLYDGETREKQGHTADALAFFKQALPLFQAGDYYQGQAETLNRIGEMEQVAGNSAEAEAAYAQALEIQERFRAGMGALIETKMRHGETQASAYRRYIGLLLETGQKEKAFEWAQKAKSRVLLDLMQSGGAGSGSPAPSPEMQNEKTALQNRGNGLTRRWLAALGALSDAEHQAKPNVSRKRNAEAQAKIIAQEQQNLEKDWRQWQEQEVVNTPRDIPAPARPASFSEIAALLPEDAALLEYCAIQTGQGKAARVGFALFVVTRKNGRANLRALRLKTDGAVLTEKANELREACASRPGSGAERLYKGLAHELYNALIAPAESALVGAKRLIICPNEALWNVPFAALLTGSASPNGGKANGVEFLWERCALVTEYSATGWKAAVDRKQNAGRPAPSQSLLVMANPDFGGNTTAPDAKRAGIRDVILRGGFFRPLPYTQAEANALRAAFPDAVIKTGSAAQESEFKRMAANFRFIHLATHAVFNEELPLLSGVALARPPINDAEDGILTARELCDMKLTADMIVFSACESGRGAAHPGEGIIGLTWAAFAAGIPAQVVSQWSVDDAATAKLMGNFYAELKRGKSKDAALRAAALSLLHDGRHAHPFYWAPFLLLGDWR